MAGARESSLRVDAEIGAVDSILLRPRNARALYVLAHGAGAGMRHPFMEEISAALAKRRVATLRYQFPYMQRGGGGPNRPVKLMATVRAAVRKATRSRLPLVAGGKSMGGRMTSLRQSEDALPGVRGLVFVGFPLHPPAKPSNARAEHLYAITIPMLFLQGQRDKLAGLRRLRPICKRLGPLATLHVVAQGDHSFKVPKRTGMTREDVIDDLADTTADSISDLVR